MPDYFSYQDNRLCAEQVPLADIARHFGTPCYVYSHTALVDGYRQFESAFAGRKHLICYAVKANSSLAILHLLARLGAGFDIVSGGELQRVLAAGGGAGKVVFSGVGKTVAEMRLALDAEILCFNVESEAELMRLNEVAGSMGRVAPVSLRVNPDVDAKTHPYIATGLRQNKFGVAYTEALGLYRKAAELPHLRVTGIDCHIGSQLTETGPFLAAAEKVLTLVERLSAEGITLEHFDLGGGLGIRYHDETPPSISDYAGALLTALRSRSEKIIVEPGRALVGNAGVLLTRVEYLKHGEEKNFAIVDAAMNDLMRPALYDAWHHILPVVREQLASPDGTTSHSTKLPENVNQVAGYLSNSLNGTTDGATSHLTNPAKDAGQVIGYSHSTRLPKAAAKSLVIPQARKTFGQTPAGERTNVKGDSLIYEVVGPVCETGDFLGHARELAIAQGDLLAVMSAGAYGMSMSSNYNSRPRAAEVMVSGTVVQLIRERETVHQLFAGEKTFLL
ncbi:MAG TPA: diaminopimelate decarboxylase [Gallionella sp.]|nr:diaminopimelate decarboxylase [Gallionella sp.]